MARKQSNQWTTRFEAENNIVLQFVREHPGCSARDIAESGIYETCGARNPVMAAKHWARRQTLLLWRKNLIEFIAGDGTRSHPVRIRVKA